MLALGRHWPIFILPGSTFDSWVRLRWLPPFENQGLEGIIIFKRNLFAMIALDLKKVVGPFVLWYGIR